MKHLYRILAIILCISLLPLSSCAPTTTDDFFIESEINQPEKITKRVFAKGTKLASAKYPARISYPSYDEVSSETYHESYSAWSNEQQNRRSLQYLAQVPEEFLRRSVKEVLSAESESNTAYSPLNFYMALALLAETTDGESRAQILELLGAENIESLRTEANRIWQANYRDDGKIATILSNALFLNKDVSYKRSTLQNATKYYYADIFRGKMGTSGYDAQIHKWLSEKTKGLLENSVNAIETDPNAQMMLLSTLYFQSKWSSKFWQSENTLDVFHTKTTDKTVEFMNKKQEMPYYQGDNFTAVCNEFSEGGSMWLILPDENVDVMEVAASEGLLDPVFSPPQADAFKPLVTLSMPKLNFTCSNKLTKALKTLGVTHAFDTKTADFSALTGKKGDYLSEVQQDVRVTVDEEGCTAVAFTKMTAVGEAIRPIPKEVIFTLDRPFIFIVVSDTDMPLFTGIVQNP